MIQQRPPMQTGRVPPQMARSPRFGAAKEIVMEGLPQLFEQLVTLKAVELVDGANRQDAMEGDPGQDNAQVAETNIKDEAQQGIINALAGMQQPQQRQQMAMQQPQQRQQMAMGLPQLPADNMAMPRAARGGIVGFAKGGMNDDRVKTKAYHPQPAIPVGNSNQPIPMLMQKYGGKKVLGYLEEKKALDAKARAIAEAGSAAGSMQVQDLRNMKEIFSEKYRDIISESMGMAGGGIVSFKEGGDDGLNPFSFVRWLGSKGLEAGALTGPQFEQLRDMYLRAGRELGDTRSVVERMADAAQSMPRNDLGRGGRSVVERMADAAQSMPRNDLGMGETPPSNAMTAEEIAAARALQGLDSGQTAPATNSFGQSVRGLLGLTNAKDATMRVAENEIQPTSNAMTAEEIAAARALQGLDSGIRALPNTRQEFPAFPSNTASNQGSVLGEVASGAAGVMMDKAGTAMSQGQIGAREAQLESGRGGLGAFINDAGNAMVNAAPNTAMSQEEISARNANVETRRGGLGAFLSNVPTMAADLANKGKNFVSSIESPFQLTDAQRREDAEAEGLTVADWMESVGMGSPTAEERSRFAGTGANPYSGRDTAQTILDSLSSAGESIVSSFGSEGRRRGEQETRRAELTAEFPDLNKSQINYLLQGEIGKGQIGSQEEVVDEATEVITSGPNTTTVGTEIDKKTIDAATTLASAAENAETAETARTGDVLEVMADLKGTPPESSLFDRKLEEIMKRSRSPARTIATFLQGYGEDRFAGANKMLRAAEAQYDAQEVELLKLREASRITQADFRLKQDKVNIDRDQLDIMRDRYEDQGENERARIKAQEAYYKVLGSGQTSSITNTLIDATVAYENSALFYSDLADELGVDLKKVQDIPNSPQRSAAKERIRRNYRQRLIAGAASSAGGAGAGAVEAADYFN